LGGWMSQRSAVMAVYLF